MSVKKLMGIAVVLVALAVAVNALAFKTANVTNTSTITVDTTSAAALAISAGTGSGFTSTIGAKGYMDVVVSQKIQPNSDYVFGPIFTVTNNNTASVTLSYSVTGLTNGVVVSLFQDAAATTSINGSLGQTAARDVYMKVSVPGTFVSGGGTLNSSQAPVITITATE